MLTWKSGTQLSSTLARAASEYVYVNVRAPSAILTPGVARTSEMIRGVNCPLAN